MSDKKFLTYSAQRSLLSGRGLIINHPRFFTNAMQTDDYYNIINGYKKYFIATMSPERYLPGTTFEQLYALYDFDQHLRALFLSAIMQVEKKIKSIIAYKFSEVYGYDHRQFLDRLNFNLSSSHNRSRAQSTLKHINDSINKYQSSGNYSICHYLNKYGYIPLWVLNGILTFGQICRFYSIMQISDQIRIAQQFHLSASEMQGFLYFLNEFRNTCAHGGRIYTHDRQRKFLKLIPDATEHIAYSIPKNGSGNYIYGKADVLAMLITLKKFLRKCEFTLLKKRIAKLFTNLSNQLPHNIMRNIDSEMGFLSRHINQL